MARFHRKAVVGPKRRRLYAVGLGGLFWALAISPAIAQHDASSACRWQPIVKGLRNLRPPADLEAHELSCGIADPVDLSPATAEAIDRIDRSLHEPSAERSAREDGKAAS